MVTKVCSYKTINSSNKWDDMAITMIYDDLNIHQCQKSYFAKFSINILFSNDAFIL